MLFFLVFIFERERWPFRARDEAQPTEPPSQARPGFSLSCSVGCAVAPPCDSPCLALTANGAEHLFICSLAICESSLAKCQPVFSEPFVIVAASCWVLSVFIQPADSPFVRYVVNKYFLAACSLCLQPLTNILHGAKAFNFDEIQLSIFFSMLLMSSLRTLCLGLDPKDFPPFFFLRIL